MSKLALSTRLFAGAIMYFAEEAAGTSDTATKPAANSALWKEIGSVQQLLHTPDVMEEKYSECGSYGWRNYKDTHTLADIWELTTREVSELFHRLDIGAAAAIVAGTAQAPFADSARTVRGWVKLQHRMHTGTDRMVLDMFCELRLKKNPGIEKKVPEPVFELWVVASALNSMVIPS